MQKLSQSELEMAVQLVRATYGKYYCKTAKELSDLINSEFDSEVKEEQVKQFIEPYIPESEDIMTLYKNVFEP